jgi:hypothetical protein
LKPVSIFKNTKKPLDFSRGFLCSGNWTRTSDLRVMSPTSYLLLYPAISTAKIQYYLSENQALF